MAKPIGFSPFNIKPYLEKNRFYTKKISKHVMKGLHRIDRFFEPLPFESYLRKIRLCIAKKFNLKYTLMQIDPW